MPFLVNRGVSCNTPCNPWPLTWLRRHRRQKWCMRAPRCNCVLWCHGAMFSTVRWEDFTQKSLNRKGGVSRFRGLKDTSTKEVFCGRQQAVCPRTSRSISSSTKSTCCCRRTRPWAGFQWISSPRTPLGTKTLWISHQAPVLCRFTVEF